MVPHAVDSGGAAAVVDEVPSGRGAAEDVGTSRAPRKRSETDSMLKTAHATERTVKH